LGICETNPGYGFKILKSVMSALKDVEAKVHTQIVC